MMTIRVYTADRLVPMINCWRISGWTLTQIEVVRSSFFFWSYFRHFVLSFERTPPDTERTLQIVFGPVVDQVHVPGNP